MGSVYCRYVDYTDFIPLMVEIIEEQQLAAEVATLPLTLD